MNCFLFTLFVIAAPLVTASYGGPSSSAGSNSAYLSAASSNGLDDLVHAGAGAGAGAGGSYAAADAEIESSDAISESLAQSSFASKLCHGAASNAADQGVYRSLLVPSGQNNHQVIATQPLPPIIVNQPALPPAHIGGGPASIIKAAPVIYKLKPSIIYQHEVINKMPTPLSLNPVYVKVIKPSQMSDGHFGAGAQNMFSSSGLHHHHHHHPAGPAAQPYEASASASFDPAASYGGGSASSSY